MTRSMSPTLPTAGLTGLHQHRGFEWRPFPLLPEGDDHADDADDGADDADADDADDAKGADDKGKDDDKKPLTAEEWQAKYEAQQRVNRDLERKTKRDKVTLDRLAAAAKGKGDSKGDDDKVDAEKIRDEAKAEARAEVLRDRVLDKIEAKAGAKFNLDPEDVAALVLRRAKDGADEFVTDGKVDAQAISDALDELLEKSPHLAAQGGKRFQGGADGGHRKGDQSGKPKQLTKSDVDRMYAARQYDEIDKARAAGQLTDLLSGNKS